MPAIEVNNTSKSFGSNRAVDQVSFDVQSGEILALLGPNGAGKTTIIRMVLDIFQPDSGQISMLEGPLLTFNNPMLNYLSGIFWKTEKPTD